jgi:xanthine dehydrogenase small subunit
MRSVIRFMFRGAPVEVSGFAPHTTLLDWLRLQARATGTKEGCAEGDCGACTVAIARVQNGKAAFLPVNACILLLGQCDGTEIVTVEDLAGDGVLHPMQEAMVAHHGSQCGFCTPGIVMSLFTLHHEGPRPVSRSAVCDALAGNLCRCTGYRPIVDAALDVCATPALDHYSSSPARVAAIGGLDDGGDVFAGDDQGFFAAPSTEDALAALYARHPDANLVGGATDFGLSITKELAEPRKIIWLGRVRGLDAITASSSELSLGAGVRLTDAAPALGGLHADLGEVMRRFGSAQVRASGTVGGNIANASPIGDLAPCLIALGARIELRRGDATRELALEDFFIAYKQQDRRPSEYLRRIIIPRPLPEHSLHIFKISKRFDEDISAVLAAFRFTVQSGRVVAARFGFGGVAGVPARARKTEAACANLDLVNEASWATALDTLAQDFTPIDDMRASATYRRLVVRNLMRKALMEARGASTSETRLQMQGWSHAAE